MLTVLEVLAVLAVLFVAAAVATRDGEVLREAAPDERDLDLPSGPWRPEDVRRVRFSMAVRGYRMDQVDGVLETLAGELARTQARLEELEGAVSPRAASSVSVSDLQPVHRPDPAEVEPRTGGPAPGV